MEDNKFMYRTWSWVEYLITLFAIIVIIKKFDKLRFKYIGVGLILISINFLSFHQRTDLKTAIIGSFVTLIGFVGGCLLTGNENRNKSLFKNLNIKALPKAFLLGILIAIPFALLNFIYFRLTIGTVQYMNVFKAALLALEPGISEEIIFRFFIMNAIFTLLDNRIKKKYIVFISFFFGIVPHSLIHFSELWISNVPAAFFMLITTSLLFGLPMAYLQYKKDLETAITFHWFIDFIRFIGGY